MKSMLAILLALQVLVCTLGQGALTLCVRRDGSQRIEWTAHGPCHVHHGHDACCHEDDDGQEQLGCDFCTDYLLVAPVAPPLSHGMPLEEGYQVAFCHWVVLTIVTRPCESHLSLHGPPCVTLPALLAVPLRC